MKGKMKLKKFLAFLMAVSMIATMNMVVFAENETPENPAEETGNEMTEVKEPEKTEEGVTEEPENQTETVVCTKDESCTAGTHEDGCPKGTENNQPSESVKVSGGVLTK